MPFAWSVSLDSNRTYEPTVFARSVALEVEGEKQKPKKNTKLLHTADYGMIHRKPCDFLSSLFIQRSAHL